MDLYSDSYQVKNKTGWLTYTEKGLYSLTLPDKRAQQPAGTINKKTNTTNVLESYFAGKKVVFFDKIDLTGFSDFEKLVLLKCRLIKYATTISYRELAAKIGVRNGSRAVGNALHKNRLPIIIPCHRIIKSDGSTGGFSSGIKLKEKLLKLEKNGK